MDSFYLLIVVCLIVLAISDLVVGVSNDAVNFLNSAFGSKVARRKTILIVATIGILVGAMSSSGMMEIARKGIFNPEMFSFADIMTIFLAVMITDIILLDLFNTFGMPTSTTVSIMFELLGAAFAISCLNIIRNGDTFSALGDYLNTSNALLIIAGIFLSVFIAFTLGLFVQYITRLVFTFNLTTSLKKVGPVFGGLAITTITYFLLIKGMKGSSFINEETNAWIAENRLLLLGSVFAGWTAICFVLSQFFKLNILRFVVLSGTFSLAMAFAGNDLVNFIGVPLAGLQSYQFFGTAGVGANELGMEILAQPLQTNTFILLIAGLIMITTLWFSKKARSVTETEINLARQSEGAERFKSNLLSRVIVKAGLRLGAFNGRLMSEELKKKVESRFTRRNTEKEITEDEPAFDLVRASVNLMMASVLIAFATSLKLPLSTTYVSFMVAMGTSLADRAWDRDSAVYRVSGVINVIGGWLFTAVVAFMAAGVLALTIHFGGLAAVIGLMVLTGYLIIRSQLMHKGMEAKKVEKAKKRSAKKRIASAEVLGESKHRISVTLFKVSCILEDLIKGLAYEDKTVIDKARDEVTSYQKEYDDLYQSFYYYLKKIDSENGAEGQFYLHALNYLQNISQSVQLISDRVFNHVNNLHKPLQSVKLYELNQLVARMKQLFVAISDVMLEDENVVEDSIHTENGAILALIDALEREHIKRVKAEKSSPKNSMLYISILLEFRDMLADFEGLVSLYDSANDPSPIKPSDLEPVLN